MSDILPETLFRSLSSLAEPGLIVDILSRLPGKYLLKFRSVSKSWRILIDSPYFIKKHITHSIKTITNLNLVIVSKRYLYTKSFGSPQFAIVLKNPLFSDDRGTKILGSCNGVLCLSTMATKNEIALLNPLTGMFKKIPMHPVNFPPCASRKLCIEGFGYDRVNDDYKVVRVVQAIHTCPNVLEPVIGVYSLKSGLWRMFVVFPYFLCDQRSFSVFASGCLHWVVREKLEPNRAILIVAFDLGTEKYRIVPQPKYSIGKFKMNLDVINGCLCVVCEYDYGVDVWMRKSYGVEESWHKLIFIPTANKSFERMRLLAYSEGSEGKVYMEEDNERIVMYDIKTKVKKVEHYGLESPVFGNVDIGSLAQLNSGSVRGSDDKKQKAKEEKEEECKGRLFPVKDVQIGTGKFSFHE